MIFYLTSYETGHLPSKWKQANINAIYRKGDKHNSKFTA